MTKTTKTVCFLITTSLAGVLSGFVVLSPKLERNRQLYEICYHRQVELVELEQKNQKREFLLSRLRDDPQLLAQLASREEGASGQRITVPEQLSIRPDTLLNLEFEPAMSASGSGVSGSGAEEEAQPGTDKHSLLRRWQIQVSQSSELRKWLMLISGSLILASFINWTRLLSPRQWNGKGLKHLKRWLRRYQIQPPHSLVSPPHYCPEQDQPRNQQTEKQTVSNSK